MESGIQCHDADTRCTHNPQEPARKQPVLLALRRGFDCMQEHSRSAKGLSTKTCWRAMCTCTLGAPPSRWQPPSSSDAAPWTAWPLEVPPLQLQSGPRALQAEAVTTPSRCQSGTGWCTSRLCPTFDLRDACTLSHAEGVQLFMMGTVRCRVRTQQGCLEVPLLPCSRGRSVRSSDSSCDLSPGLSRWPTDSPAHSSPERTYSEQPISSTSAGEVYDEVDSLRPAHLPALVPRHKRSNSHSDVQTPHDTPPRTPTHGQHGEASHVHHADVAVLSLVLIGSMRICVGLPTLAVPQQNSRDSTATASRAEPAPPGQQPACRNGVLDRSTSAQLQQNSHRLPAPSFLTRSASVTTSAAPAHLFTRDADGTQLARAASVADTGRDEHRGQFSRACLLFRVCSSIRAVAHLCVSASKQQLTPLTCMQGEAAKRNGAV